ncbi:MAG TPA: cytochrome c3 family protein [Pyrinomonadaceae bacterium]|nr:cytochrome c3 family protein [Pyrinomonadaceae bacterium]
MQSVKNTSRSGFRTVVVIAFALTVLAAGVRWRSDDGAAAQARRRAQVRRAAPSRPAPRRYSAFSHATPQHRQACDSCHKFPSPNWKDVRQGDAAFPDVTQYPQHASCIGCHKSQFFEGPRPAICSNCHSGVTPRNTTRHLFPSLGEPFYATPKGVNFVSDFRVYFPHDKHLEVVSSLRERGGSSPLYVRARFQTPVVSQESDPKNCAVCHQTYQPQGKSEEEYATQPPKDVGEAFWLKKGTFKTVPLTHQTCFTCHSQESGIEPAANNCNACHKLPAVGSTLPTHVDFLPALARTMGVRDEVTLRVWRRRQSAGTFRHEGGMHPDLACTACHQVATMNTLDDLTLKVPVASCSPCHTEGGALEEEVRKKLASAVFRCAKCHVTFGREAIPASHLKEVPAAAPK